MWTGYILAASAVFFVSVLWKADPMDRTKALFDVKDVNSNSKPGVKKGNAVVGTSLLAFELSLLRLSSQHGS